MEARDEVASIITNFLCCWFSVFSTRKENKKHVAVYLILGRK